MLRNLPKVDLRESYVPYKGGLDVVTPPLSVDPSTCFSSQNVWEDINGGYQTALGYERFNGQPSPSDANYSILQTTITGTVSLGDILTDNGGANLGTVIATTVTYTVLTKVTGTFVTGDIKVGAVVVGTCVGPQVESGASTVKLANEYKGLAAEQYRVDIAAPAGSGGSLGGFRFGGVTYTFRNNAGGTAVDLHKSSASGWVQVALGFELAFTSGGTTEIVEGNTITGAISGETAVLTRVVLESGSWAAGTAAGRFIYASQSGAFQAENIDVGASPNLASIAADGTAITLPVVSGNFKTTRGNFTASLDTVRVYGCDGKNRGFEFDGTVFVPIATGMSTDAPELVIIHKNHLFFSFLGTAQHSAPGLPYKWSVVVGAAELGIGDQITGWEVQSGDASTSSLAIFARNSIHVLYGSGVADWSLVSYKEEAGALAESVQTIGQTFMLDDRGIVSMRRSQAYGNFSDSAWSDKVLPWLNDRKALIVSSVIVREKNHYYLFFSDKYSLCVTIIDGKPVSMMPQLMKDNLLWIESTEDTDGTEIIFFGDDTGMVYQFNKGTSYDGDTIEVFMSLAYNHFKTPYIEKKFRSALFEIQGTGYSEFSVAHTTEYASFYTAQSGLTSQIVSSLGGVFWDSLIWDAFVWDGVSLIPFRLPLKGTGTNISVSIYSNSSTFDSVRFSGMLLQYSLGRKRR